MEKTIRKKYFLEIVHRKLQISVNQCPRLILEELNGKFSQYPRVNFQTKSHLNWYFKEYMTKIRDH